MTIGQFIKDPLDLFVGSLWFSFIFLRKIQKSKTKTLLYARAGTVVQFSIIRPYHASLLLVHLEGWGRGNGSQWLALDVTTTGKGGAYSGPRNPRAKELSTIDNSLGMGWVLGRTALRRTVSHDSLTIRETSSTLTSGMVLVLKHLHGLVFVPLHSRSAQLVLWLLLLLFTIFPFCTHCLMASLPFFGVNPTSDYISSDCPRLLDLLSPFAHQNPCTEPHLPSFVSPFGPSTPFNW